MKNNLQQLFFFIFSLILIFIFFYTDIIHKTYVPYWKDSFDTWPFKTYSDFKYFGDTQTLLMAAECFKSGFDVFYGECISDYGIKTGHDYGRTLLYLPLIPENLKSFFLIIFGAILISLLIFFVFKLVKPKSFFENIICLILIFNPTTLLLFERLNLDLIIFLFLVLIVFLKKSLLIKIFIKFLLFSFKYYPIFFVINFFVENNINLKRKLLYSAILIVISFLLLIYNFDDLKYVVGDFEKVGRNIKYSFSINSFSRIIEHFNIMDVRLIKPILILFLLVFSYIIFLFLQKNIKAPLKKEINYYYPRARLFFISTNLLIVLYLFFNNNYFREVFFIGVIPYLLIIKNNKCLFSNLCLSLIILKYLFMILFWPIVLFENINTDLFAQILLGIKIIFDYIIIMFLISYILKLNIIIFKKNFNLKLL